MRKFILMLICCSLFLHPIFAQPRKPKLVVAIVIDQFAHHYLGKLKQYFDSGFKFLLDNGVCYHDTHQPHGAPSTAPGHASMSTGTIPRDHGVILNGWVEQGKKVVFGDDDSPNAQILTNPHLHLHGKSSHHLLTETVADRLMLASTEESPNKAFALSYKSRAAIALAGQKAKPIWFDSKSMLFSSSKAYFDTLPIWVDTFNKEHAGTNLKSVSWALRFPMDDDAYKFYGINDRRYATRKQKLANTTISLTSSNNDEGLDVDEQKEKRGGPAVFIRTPAANQMLFDLARECLNKNYSSSDNGTFLLWISLSSLDMLGHEYGPHSLEIIDMLYHLDKQVGDFMDFCKKQAGSENTCFMLTADHGVAPFPEVLQEQKFWLAKRIPIKPLTKKMNAYIEKKYSIPNAVTHFKSNQIYVNIAINKHRQKILRDLKLFLSKQPGIKKVWTRNELLSSTYQSYQIESLFKNQYHLERSGDLICMTYPYHALTPNPTGTVHRSPYDYDTHIPLIFYHEGSLENKNIYEKTWSPQIAVSLAHIMGISKPAAARYEVLPGIAD